MMKVNSVSQVTELHLCVLTYQIPHGSVAVLHTEFLNKDEVSCCVLDLVFGGLVIVFRTLLPAHFICVMCLCEMLYLWRANVERSFILSIRSRWCDVTPLSFSSVSSRHTLFYFCSLLLFSSSFLCDPSFYLLHLHLHSPPLFSPSDASSSVTYYCGSPLRLSSVSLWWRASARSLRFITVRARGQRVTG